MPILNIYILSMFIITLFCIGLFGIIINRKNIILTLMSIEIVLLSMNLHFIVISYYLDDMVGQIFSLFIILVAASETAVGLAILIAYYRVRNSIAIERLQLLRG